MSTVRSSSWRSSGIPSARRRARADSSSSAKTAARRAASSGLASVSACSWMCTRLAVAQPKADQAAESSPRGTTARALPSSRVKPATWRPPPPP